MSFLDKVKQAAEKAAEGAKKGTAQVREKMELSQLRKKADEDARQLGYLIVREREGTPAGEETDRLVQEIQALGAQIEEAAEEHAATEAASASASASGDGGAQPAPVDVTPGEAPPMPGEQPAPPPPAPPTSSSEAAPGDFKLD
ncbi:MAG: hypothetical protein M3Q23_17465 [Actinomycetota bacterium]|nr:hypothetical protein [Actinomycetota bacterium]